MDWAAAERCRVVVVDHVIIIDTVMTTWYRSIDAVAHGDHRLQVQAWPRCAAACESIPIGGTCRLRAFAILACPSLPNRPDHHQHAQQFAATPHPLNSRIGMRVMIALTFPRADRTGRLNPSKLSIWHLLCSPPRGPRRRAGTSTTNRNSWIHDILQICTAKLAATCNAAVHMCGAALLRALCVLHTHIRDICSCTYTAHASSAMGSPGRLSQKLWRWPSSTAQSCGPRAIGAGARVSSDRDVELSLSAWSSGVHPSGAVGRLVDLRAAAAVAAAPVAEPLGSGRLSFRRR